MKSTPAGTGRADINAAWMLAALLERLENSTTPVDPSQYRAVVEYLRGELGHLEPSLRLTALLDAHPAAAELYENLHYSKAGLCRAPLHEAMRADLQTNKLIVRAMRSSRGAGPAPTT